MRPRFDVLDSARVETRLRLQMDFNCRGSMQLAQGAEAMGITLDTLTAKINAGEVEAFRGWDGPRIAMKEVVRIVHES